MSFWVSIVEKQICQSQGTLTFLAYLSPGREGSRQSCRVVFVEQGVTCLRLNCCCPVSEGWKWGETTRLWGKENGAFLHSVSGHVTKETGWQRKSHVQAPVSLVAKLSCTLRPCGGREMGESQCCPQHLKSGDDLWSVAGVLIPRLFWQLQLVFKFNDKLMKVLWPYENTSLLLIFSDSVAYTRLHTSCVFTEHFTWFLNMWLMG